MIVKELKEILKDIDDNIEIGATGHFGEFLECYDVRVEDVFIDKQAIKAEKKILHFSMELPSDAPQ